jgi:endonuclease/exonuclease/phosphatase family metal-dependent hydrolase
LEVPVKLSALFLAGIAACGLLVPVVTAAPAAQAATTQQLRLIQYNINGGHNGGGLGVLDFLNDRIAEYSPDVVTLEEVCATQFHAFQADHPTWNVWWVHLIAAPDYDYCGSGDDARIGEVLASPWPLSNLVVNALGPSEQRSYSWGTVTVDYRLMCADLDVGGFPAGKVRACVTHLRPGGNATAADRTTDTSIIRSRLSSYIAAGSEVVLGGDFNAIPSRAEMDNIYRLTTGNSPTGPGQFWEADENYNCSLTRCRGGEITHPATGGVDATKIDYGFYSTNHVTGRLSGLPYGDDAPTHPDNLCTTSGGIKTVDCSDHYLYRAYATVTM